MESKLKIIRTSESDPIERLNHWNPLIRKAYRSRYSSCLNQIIKHSGNLLELGIGGGYTIPFLINKGFKVIGLDLHDKLKYIKKIYEDVDSLVRGNALNLPFVSDSIDVVLVVSLLEHLDDPKKAILEIKRVLKKNGKVVIGIPIKNFLTSIWFFLTRSCAFHEHRSHRSIIKIIKKYLKVIYESKLSLLFPFLTYYTVLRCKNVCACNEKGEV